MHHKTVSSPRPSSAPPRLSLPQSQPVWDHAETTRMIQVLSDRAAIFDFQSYLRQTALGFLYPRSKATRALDGTVARCFERFQRLCLAAAGGELGPGEALYCIKQCHENLQAGVSQRDADKGRVGKRSLLIGTVMQFIYAARQDIDLALHNLYAICKWVEKQFIKSALQLRAVQVTSRHYDPILEKNVTYSYGQACRRYETASRYSTALRTFTTGRLAFLAEQLARLVEATQLYQRGLPATFYNLIHGLPDGEYYTDPQFIGTRYPRLLLPSIITEEAAHRSLSLSAIFRHTDFNRIRMTAFEQDQFEQHMDHERHSDFITRLMQECRNVPLAMRGLHAYTHFGYQVMNTLLRGGEIGYAAFWEKAGSNPSPSDRHRFLTDTLWLIHSACDSLNRLPAFPRMGARTYVFRGCPFDPEFMEDYVVGETVCERGFTSTSMRLSRVFSGMVTYVIRCSSGKDVSAVARSQTEREVLFLPNTRFLVTGVQSAEQLHYRDGAWSQLEGYVITLKEVS